MRLRTALVSSAVLVPLVLHASAQRHDPDALATSTTDASSSTAPVNAHELAIMDRYLTTVQAEPAAKIDTRNAVTSQPIALRVSQNVTLANGTQLPRGTRLTGHILRAQSYEKDHSSAMLAITIDHAELSGRSIPIHCVIRALASGSQPAQPLIPMQTAASGMPMSDPLSREMSSLPLGGPGGSISADSSINPMGTPGSTSGSRGGSSNPGVLNPSNPNAPSITRGTAGMPMPTGDPGLGGGSPSLGGNIPGGLNSTATSAAPAAVAPVVAAGESIHDAPRQTRVPGVMLSGASNANVSGILSSFDRNIILDSSTHLTLGIIATQ